MRGFGRGRNSKKLFFCLISKGLSTDTEGEIYIFRDFVSQIRYFPVESNLNNELENILKICFMN
jgi:hypothetical protein